MPRIGVIADTHIHDGRPAIPPALLDGLAGVDIILHAGDLTDERLIAALERIATVHAVCGNCDPPALVAQLPTRRVVEVGGMRIGLTHGHLGRGRDTPRRALAYCAPLGDLRAIVFGHSHQPHNAMLDGVLLFNPGSPTQRRRAPYPSYGLLEIGGGQIRGRVVSLR
jgi:uncharacterized protein